MRDDAVAAIRAAKVRRLEQLELQAAREGYDTPAEVKTEIDDLRAQLGFLDVLEFRPDEDVKRAMRRYDQSELNISVLSSLAVRVTNVEAHQREAQMVNARQNLMLYFILALMLADIAVRLMVR